MAYAQQNLIFEDNDFCDFMIATNNYNNFYNSSIFQLWKCFDKTNAAYLILQNKTKLPSLI